MLASPEFTSYLPVSVLMAGRLAGMPKVAKELSVRAINALKHPGMYAVGGVPGLYLQIVGNARTWILRTLVAGKRREIGLGSCGDVSLADARDKARVMRSKVADGIDPLAERRKARAALLITGMTFQEAAKRLMESKAAGWKNAKHRAQWSATLATYAYPSIGKLPVDAIEIAHITSILSPIWTTKTETAKRLQGRMEAVLAWATVSGYRKGDNPATWKNNLDKILPAPGKVRKVKHHTAMPLDGMPEFTAALRLREGTAARALELAILTATRSQEIRGATWSEIDLDAATWTIPGDRMKAGKPHAVPLAPAAIKLLRALPRFAGNDLVFPSPTGKVLSDMTLAAVLKRMGVDAVPHGFRSTFRDWAAERSSYPRDVAEMALAHTIGDKVEAAYRRGDLFAKRTKMMADWAKFIATLPHAGNVTTYPAPGWIKRPRQAR